MLWYAIAIEIKQKEMFHKKKIKCLNENKLINDAFSVLDNTKFLKNFIDSEDDPWSFII